MTVLLNGQPRSLKAGASLLDLLSDLKLTQSGVAVAVNGHIVSIGRRAEHLLNEGDRVELIRAVGGG